MDTGRPPYFDSSPGCQLQKNGNVVKGLTAGIKMSFLQTYTSLSKWFCSNKYPFKQLKKLLKYIFTVTSLSQADFSFPHLVPSYSTRRWLGLIWYVHINEKKKQHILENNVSQHFQRKNLCFEATWISIFIINTGVQNASVMRKHTCLWRVKAWEREAEFSLFLTIVKFSGLCSPRSISCGVLEHHKRNSTRHLKAYSTVTGDERENL